MAMTASIDRRVGTTTLGAEDARLRKDTLRVTPDSLWTGESLFQGSGYVAIGSGGSVTFSLRPARALFALPVFDLRPGSSAVTTFRADDDPLGRVASGDIGPQGDSPAPGALLPMALSEPVHGGVTQLSATTTATDGDRARLDAVMLEPVVSRLVLSGDHAGTALLSNASDRLQRRQVLVAGSGAARIEWYDSRGRLVDVRHSQDQTVQVTVLPSGFTFVRR